MCCSLQETGDLLHGEYIFILEQEDVNVELVPLKSEYVNSWMVDEMETSRTAC